METIAADVPISSTTETGIDVRIVTTKHKRWQVVKICIIAVLTILSLTFLVADVAITVKNVKRQKKMKEYIEIRSEVSSSINFLQDKTDETTSHLLLSLLTNTTRLKQLRQQLPRDQFSFAGRNKTDIKDFESVMKSIRRLKDLKIMGDNDSSLVHNLSVYTARIKALMSWLVNNSQSRDDANYLAAYDMIVKSREEFETEKSLGAFLYFRGNVIFQNISQRRIRGETFLETARLLSPAVNDNYLSLKQNTSLWLAKRETKRQHLSSNPPNISNASVFSEWFNLTSKYCHLLVRLENKEAQRISSNIEKSIKKNTLLLILRSVLVCVVLIILPFFIISLVKVQNEFYKYAHFLHHKVVLEKSRTEFLLSENSRHMAGLAERWKEFSQQSNAENRDDQTQPRGSIKECWANNKQ